MSKKLFAELRKRGTAGMALAVLLVPGGESHTPQAPLGHHKHREAHDGERK